MRRLTFEENVPETTVEALFDGQLTCCQHRSGYRFTQDPVLLAHFFTPLPYENIIDLGTGCGIIPLILAYRWSGLSITGLEIQPALAELARQNVDANCFPDRIKIVEGDLRSVNEYFESLSFDRVLSNPPYRVLGAARPNPDPEQAIARHEIMASLTDVLTAATGLLAEGGRIDLVYPEGRSGEVLDAMQEKGLAPSRLQRVHSYPDGPCKLFLVEGVKGGGEKLEVLAPFYVQRGPEGGYTEEMAKLYEV